MTFRFLSILTFVGVIVFSQFIGISESCAACGPPTYAGCTGAELRAIQSGQFYNRKIAPTIQSRQVIRSDSYSSAHNYWTDRQYQDRKDAEARREREEARKLEAQTRRYEAKRYSKQIIQYGGNVYINGYGSKNYRSAPISTELEKPELKGSIYSKPRTKYKKISNANDF